MGTTDHFVPGRRSLTPGVVDHPWTPKLDLQVIATSTLGDAPRELPDLIYHYTTIEGFRQILGSGKLWATHIRYLNDKSEYLHIFNVLKAKAGEAPLGDEKASECTKRSCGSSKPT
jgi:hypothetical protein